VVVAVVKVVGSPLSESGEGEGEDPGKEEEGVGGVWKGVRC
jgi:hypothetical protein